MTTDSQTPALHCMVEMTRLRDHARLEQSVVSALRHLVRARQVRKLEFFMRGDVAHVRPVLLFDEREQVVDATPNAECDPLSAYPELVRCIDQRGNYEMRELAGTGGCVVWLPFRLADTVVACLELSHDEVFEPQQLEVINAIMDVFRNYHALLDYSERDALTGLLNRKTFDDQFAGIIQPATVRSAYTTDRPGTTNQRESSNDVQWLGVIDIDHFKRVNDQFGHVYGDEVLILVANVLKASFREEDRIFRFGGEEFVVLLRSATADIARAVFERFRCRVETHVFPRIGQVTVSLGFTASASGAPVEVLGHADQALYHAKKTGRNRVCYYEELHASGALGTSKAAHGDVELF